MKSIKITQVFIYISLVVLGLYLLISGMDPLLYLAIMFEGLWVYFEFLLFFGSILDILYGGRNPKFFRESILFGIKTDPSAEIPSNKRMLGQLYVMIFLTFIPLIVSTVLLIIYKSPPFILLTVLYFEITVFVMFFHDESKKSANKIYWLKKDPEYTEKARLLDKCSKEVLGGKHIADYPEGTFIEPPEINHPLDFFIGLNAAIILESRKTPEKEAEAKRLFLRLMANVPYGVPDNSVDICRFEYIQLMFLCDDPLDEILEFYESIKDKLVINETDTDETVASKNLVKYAVSKLIEKDDEAAAEAMKQVIEFAENKNDDRVLTELKNYFARIDEKANVKID
jgi:hypothetical protein